MPDESVRLQPLVARIGQVDAAREQFSDVRAEYGEALRTFENYQRQWSMFKAMEGARVPEGEDPPPPFPKPDHDPDIERDGRAASKAIVAAGENLDRAERAFTAELAAMVRAGTLRVGDRVRTLRSAEPLTVADLWVPADPALAEAVLTADGREIVRELHSWDLDGDGKAVGVDEIEPVAYERWAQGGMRVAGTVHPESRQLLSTS